MTPNAQTSRTHPRRWGRAAIAGVAVLACGTMTAGPALAGSSGDGPSVAVEWSQHQRRHAGGTITGVDGTNVLVTQRDGTPLTITTTDGTVITQTSVAALADVTPGSYVVMRTRTADDGTVTAKRIHIKPAPTDSAQAAGWTGWHDWRRGLAGVVESHDLTAGVITVTTDEGPVVVSTTPETTVKRTVVLSVAELTVGSAVWAKGTAADDGSSFAATRLTVFAAAEVPPVTPPVEPPPTTEAPSPTTPPAAPPTDDDGSDDGASPSNSRYHGTVNAVDGATFSLTLRDGTTVTVVTNDATEFRNKLDKHRDDGVPASIAEVTVGAWVKVKGALTEGSILLAEKVTIGPLVDQGDGWNAGKNRDGRGDHHDRSGRDGSKNRDGKNERGNEHGDDRDGSRGGGSRGGRR